MRLQHACAQHVRPRCSQTGTCAWSLGCLSLCNTTSQPRLRAATLHSDPETRCKGTARDLAQRRTYGTGFSQMCFNRCGMTFQEASLKHSVPSRGRRVVLEAHEAGQIAGYLPHQI